MPASSGFGANAYGLNFRRRSRIAGAARRGMQRARDCGHPSPIVRGFGARRVAVGVMPAARSRPSHDPQTQRHPSPSHPRSNFRPLQSRLLWLSSYSGFPGFAAICSNTSCKNWCSVGPRTGRALPDWPGFTPLHRLKSDRPTKVICGVPRTRSVQVTCLNRSCS